MDMHKADSIDCPEYRETFGTTDEAYQNHLRIEQIKNGENNPNNDEILTAIEELDSRTENLVARFDQYIEINKNQMSELLKLIASECNVKNSTDFLNKADTILNNQVTKFMETNDGSN
jgi:uncharacterized protein (DUF927 family)